jgi:GlcNAc-P-P-Und epimerase
MARVAVTGSSGFIGTNAMASLAAGGHDLLGLDIETPRDQRHLKFWQNVDICNHEQFAAVIEQFKPEAILHLAARTDLHGTRVDDYNTNIEGVANLIRIVEKSSSLTRVIFASSRMVKSIGTEPEDPRDYDPPNPYGRSKAIGEQLVREAHLNVPWLIVRPTSIWGPWFRVPYRDFFDLVQRGYYVHPRGKLIFKSFGYVENTIYQLERLLLDSTISGETLYLADYEPLELHSWAKMIASCSNKKGPLEVPVSVLQIAAEAGTLVERLTGRDAKLTRFRLNNLLTPMVFDMTRLRSIVGECPVGIQEGVRRTIAYMRNEPHELI